jgi:hypothetical protein
VEEASTERWDGREEAEIQLAAAVRRILGSSMGVRYWPIKKGSEDVHELRGAPNPLVSAAHWLIVYPFLALILFWSLFWLLNGVHSRGGTSVPPHLLSLLLWGGLYFSAAIFLAQNVTLKIYDTVRYDILPHASASYVEAVTKDLDTSYGPRFLLWLPLAVASVSLIAALMALRLDPDIAPLFADYRQLPALVVWSLSYFLYFAAAAVAVVAGRFYSTFARHLEIDRSTFYLLRAVDTPLVRGLAKLGAQVLTFWVCIFLAILSSMLLAVLPIGVYRLPPDSVLLFTMVPITGFFSLGFGTLVYLDTEARIRSNLQRFVHKQARILQEKVNALSWPAKGRPLSGAVSLERLAALHDQILAGGRYGSRASAAVSIALPLLMPVASLVVSLFTR